MKLPIPDDWDGESWTCVQVQWPDSPKYLGVLLGFLSYLTRGRTYDESSGIIKDAQAIGWQIFNRNYGLTPCASEAQATPPDFDQWSPECAFDDLGAFWEEDCIMAGVLDIKIEGGKLWKRMSPCCEWIEVGDMDPAEVLSDEIIADVVEATGSGYNACGKSYAALDLIFGVADAIWDASSDMPWQWTSNVKDRYPGISLTSYWIVMAITQIGMMAALGHGHDTVFDESTRQTVLCRLAARFNNDEEGMSDSNWHFLQGLFMGEYPPSVPNFFQYVMFAIGQGDLDTVTKLGAADDSQDCGCPASDYEDEYSTPNGDGWYLSDPLDTLVLDSTPSSSWTETCRIHNLTRGAYGLVFEVFHPTGSPGDLKQMSGSTTCPGSLPDPCTTIWAGGGGGLLTSHPRVASGNTDVLDSLFGAGGYQQRNGGGTFSSVPGTPRFYPGMPAVEAWHLGWNVDDYAEIRKLRWIYHEDDD